MRAGKGAQEACELAARRVISWPFAAASIRRRVAYLALDPKGHVGAACTAMTDFQYAVARPGKVELLKAKEIGPV